VQELRLCREQRQVWLPDVAEVAAPATIGPSPKQALPPLPLSVLLCRDS
jgi:hypothetical protein